MCWFCCKQWPRNHFTQTLASDKSWGRQKSINNGIKAAAEQPPKLCLLHCDYLSNANDGLLSQQYRASRSLIWNWIITQLTKTHFCISHTLSWCVANFRRLPGERLAILVLALFPHVFPEQRGSGQVCRHPRSILLLSCEVHWLLTFLEHISEKQLKYENFVHLQLHIHIIVAFSRHSSKCGDCDQILGRRKPFLQHLVKIAAVEIVVTQGHGVANYISRVNMRCYFRDMIYGK